MASLICPHCGCANISAVSYEYSGKATATQYTAAFAGVFMDGAGKEIANQIVPGAGLLFSVFKPGQKLAANVADKLTTPTSGNCVCNNCDCLFNVQLDQQGEVKDVSLKKPPMPVEIIEQVRTTYIENQKMNRPYGAFATMGIVVFLSTWLCYAVYDPDSWSSIFGVMMLCFLWLASLIISIVLVSKISKMNIEIRQSYRLSPLEFKRSHRNLFPQYPQYN
ncbi:MAG: hypothetical protein ACI304_01775 [Lepagella sp.]